MRTAQEWTEPDIQALITEQRPEDLSLEYKAAAALDKTQGKKADISKDVSAMANSAGGTIILDPVDPAQISIEWLEQVIDSGIQRRIPGLRIHRIGLKSSPSRVVYVVSIPPSNLAPHIASDHRFHKRLGTTTAMMEEYEVRDVSRRLDAPALEVFLPMAFAPPSLVISPYVENKSPFICSRHLDSSRPYFCMEPI
jgi:predicted HTH transcriptional regulator